MEVESNPGMPPDAEQGIADLTGREVAHTSDVVKLGHGFGLARSGSRRHVIDRATLGW